MKGWAAVLGAIDLACMIVPTALGARQLRERRLGGEGPSAVLVVVITTILQICVVAYLLGAVGCFRRWPMAVGCIVMGGILVALGRRSPAPDRLPAEGSAEVSSTMWPKLLSGLAVLVVSAQYITHTLVSVARGMYDSDTLWYHAPTAARFVQEGWLTRLYFAGGEPLVTYYPANGELVAAMVMLPFHSDALLPAVNLGWLALALLAGWCIGRRYGRGPIGMSAVALIASVPVVATREAGTLGNDLPAVALLLASAALLLEAEWRWPWLALSGAAAGLAFGVKLSAIPPVVVFAVALTVAAPARQRLRSAAAWGAGFAPIAWYWPIRDWARTGNPFPWWSLSLGPIHFASVPLPGETLHNTDVLHFVGRASSWSRIFAPGLKLGWGPGWPVILALTALGLSVIVSGRDRPGRALAATGLVGLAIYTGIPNSVFSGPLVPYTFIDTSRYALPALSLVLVAASSSRLLARKAAAVATTAILVALVILAQVPRDFQRVTPSYPLPAGKVVLGFLIAGSLALAGLGWTRTTHRQSARLGAPVFAGLAVLLALEPVGSTQYRSSSATSTTSGVYSWGRHVDHTRIGTAGSWDQFPFYGASLGNYVQYVSLTGPKGTFVDPADCRTWRRAVDEGRYDYLVIFRPAPWDPQIDRDRWVKSDRNAALVSHYADGDVWRLHGPLDPSGCASN